MSKQIEISVHASNDHMDVRQASVTMDIPDTDLHLERKMAESVARLVAGTMTKLWSGYRVTASATVVVTERHVLSSGDVDLSVKVAERGQGSLDEPR
jgi:hypothetical protein